MQSPYYLRIFLFAFVLMVFLILENFFPFRKPFQSKVKRAWINLSLGIINAVLLNSIFYFLIFQPGENFLRKGPQLLQWFPLSDSLQFILLFIVFDLLLYFWHRANHEIPFLWRFHQMHHTDLEIDVTTASRFHLGELVFASFYKILMMILLGPSLKLVIYFDISFLIFTQFNHSNIKLRRKWESAVEKMIVTPWMHRIHHSMNARETNSNYGTIFSFWDKLFKSFTQRESQESLRTGLPDFSNPTELEFLKLWTIPRYHGSVAK